MKKIITKNLIFYIGTYFTILMTANLFFLLGIQTKIQENVTTTSAQFIQQAKANLLQNELNKETINKRFDYLESQNELISKATKTISDTMRSFLISVSAANLLCAVFVWLNLRKNQSKVAGEKVT